MTSAPLPEMESRDEAMATEPAIQVIRAVLAALRESRCVFGVLHGLEHFPERHGRDIDMLVAPEHAAKATAAVMSALEREGWQAGFHRMVIGLDQAFGLYRREDGSLTCLEFDLIHNHPFCWAGQELIPAGLAEADLVEDRGYPSDPWGWFIKNLFIQLLAGKEEKFRRNMAEFASKTSYLPIVRRKAAVLGLGAAVERVLTADPKCPELRGQVRRQVLARLVSPHQWPSIARGVMPWLRRTWRLHFPFDGCVPKVHLVAADQAELNRFAGLLKDRIEDGFPFPSVVVRKGRRVERPGAGVVARILSLRSGGWSRQLRDSSWLMLQVETWCQAGEDAIDPGTPVTAGDFTYRLRPSAGPEAVKEAVDLVAGAFLANLHRHA